MIKNSWNAANEHFQKLLKDQPELVADLEKHWCKGFDAVSLADFYDADHFEGGADAPLEAFKASIASGVIPSVKTLLGVCHCFETYDRSAGTEEYENIFHGPSVERIGNYSAQTFKPNAYEHFHELVGLYRQVSQGRPTQTELAARFVELNPSLGGDEDSFLRGYRRWLKANLAS